jgi:thymidylate synthase
MKQDNKEEPSLNNISFPYKNISEKYSDAELKWYWSGDNSCHEIGKYAKMWLKLSDDGITNNSAYGYILFKKYGFNQLEQIIQLLENDKNSRRAVLNISDPEINRITTKDMQCTIAIQFLVRNNKVNMTVYMRSNDVYFGLPYDYIFFETIHQYICKRLNLNVGIYTHIATSLHMYERDIAKFKIENTNKISISLLDIEKYYIGE